MYETRICRVVGYYYTVCSVSCGDENDFVYSKCNTTSFFMYRYYYVFSHKVMISANNSKRLLTFFAACYVIEKKN